MPEITSPLFSDDRVLLASSSNDLQLTQRGVSAECEAARMRTSTQRCEAWFSVRKRVFPAAHSGEVSTLSGQVSLGLVHE